MQRRSDLTHDLFLPTLLFMAMGGMTWAVRGCSGYGASAGCIFAGVMWGAGWWYLSHETYGPQTRRYHSAWIILALTLGIGFSGSRGWMQWVHFWNNKLYTDYAAQEFVDIPRYYGYIWLFIAGMPWAGIGACLLAWCSPKREMRVWDWILRIAFGVGGGYLGLYLFRLLPDVFLPLHSTMAAQYDDLKMNPSLRRMINDNRSAIMHLGYYLGFLLFEVVRRDWKNVILISTVGILNGLGWAAFQNWEFHSYLWPNEKFNFWRCWESSGGLSIGFALGIAYYLVNRPMSNEEAAELQSRPSLMAPTFEWFVVFSGLMAYSSLFLRGQTASKSFPQGISTYCLLILQIFAVVYYVGYRRYRGDSSESTAKTSNGRFAESAAVVVGLGNAALLFFPELYRFAFQGQPGERGEMQIAFYWTLLAFNLLALGWWYVNRSTFNQERILTASSECEPNLERLGLYLGLLFGLGHSARSGLKGWFNIYLKNEDFWSEVLWKIMGPLLILAVLGIVLRILLKPLPKGFSGVLFPHSYEAIWLVLIVQNILALMVTGPLSNWSETQFAFYYVQLFLLTAVIVAHYRLLKSLRAPVSAS